MQLEARDRCRDGLAAREDADRGDFQRTGAVAATTDRRPFECQHRTTLILWTDLKPPSAEAVYARIPPAQQ